LAAALLTLATGCGSDAPPAPPVVPPPARLSGHPAYAPQDEPALAVLPLVPADATTLTVTDLDRVRAQLGVPEMTSADPVTDRTAFWERAASAAPLLTDGLLRADGSRLMLDYGFTEDDVDWEAHFSGPDGAGWVLGLRPDLPLDGVRRAVQDGVGPLAGAQLDATDHLLTSGAASDGADSWATDPAFVGLLGAPTEATYVHRGCLPLDDALGPDATQADRDRVTTHQDLTDLQPLDAVVLELGDHVATVRMPVGRTDLFDRLHLGEWWPREEGPAFATSFTDGVGDPATGRIGYHVPHPGVAVGLVLGETLPFGVCDSAG
ncbi:MAG: hypothetical protein ACXVW4_07315, partial [Nocardioides sp.]